MRRLSLFLIVISGLLATVGCSEPQDVEPTRTLTPTPEPTPTPTPPPTPISIDAAYHITSMTVATRKSDAVDIDGDGKPDYGLESALNETVHFMVGLIDALLDELVDAGLVPPEASLAVKTAAQAALKSALNVDTFNEGLATMLQKEHWVQVLASTGETEVELTFFTSTPVGGGYSTLGPPLGDPFAGGYDQDTGEVDVSGGNVTLSIPLVSNGSQALTTDFKLMSCRDVQSYQPDRGLNDAILGGAIPVQAIVDTVDKVMGMVGILGLMPDDMVEEMQHDVETFVNGLGDVTVDGKDAVSISLVYTGDLTDVY